MDKAGATNEELGKKMGGFANLRVGMLEGDMNKGYVSLGNGNSHIHEIKSAEEIISVPLAEKGRMHIGYRADFETPRRSRNASPGSFFVMIPRRLPRLRNSFRCTGW